jgi:hypothetical protein
MIISAGKNIYPEDIEETLGNIEWLNFRKNVKNKSYVRGYKGSLSNSNQETQNTANQSN